jgi:hypothetical protein
VNALATIGVSAVRATLAAALAPLEPGDPDVIPYFADAAAPPVILMQWEDPWLEAGADGRGMMDQSQYTARLEVFVVTTRLEPERTLADLEQMVSYVIRRLMLDPYAWWVPTVDVPGALQLGGVDYAACRLHVRAPATPDEMEL